MPDLVLEAIDKTFDKVNAVIDVNLRVKEGEFLTLLGPSGSGKTTLLRMIAGLEEVSSGRISFDNRVINDIPPWNRGFGFVFQKYALFPHMKVGENISYGLRNKKINMDEKQKRVLEVASKLQISDLLDRLPSQLSAGQQQRVALARALAFRPAVLLMDEPLANLDARLRARVRFELKTLQSELGITTIYVTHDQDEAFALGDRIVVINEGRIEQVGVPSEIYDRPQSAFVAFFIGKNNNILSGWIASCDKNRAIFRIGNWLLEVLVADSTGLIPGKEATAIIRSEDIEICREEVDNKNLIQGKVVSYAFLGSGMRILVDAGFPFEVILQDKEYIEQISVGQPLSMKPDVIHLFPGTLDEKWSRIG